MSNCSTSFNEQSFEYEKLAKAKENIYDEDTIRSLTVINEVFISLSRSFKKWGNSLRFYLFRNKLRTIKWEWGNQT